MTVIMVSGGIDLSVGSMVGLTGVCGAMLINAKPTTRRSSRSSAPSWWERFAAL